MDVTEFVLRLFLLFFPGVIGAAIANALTVHRPKQPFFFCVQALMYGFAAYLLAAALIKFCGAVLHPRFNLPTELTFFTSLQDAKQPLSFAEIGWTTIVAIILSLLASAISTWGIAYKLARKLGVSKRSGNLDVWGYVLNSEHIVYITVRDIPKDLVYDGWVEGFSDDAVRSELLLRDVAIYRNSTGEFMYQVGAVYLDLKGSDIVLEFRDVPITNTIEPAKPL